MKRALICIAALGLLLAESAAAGPVQVIFDTDIGNDIDDVLALSVLHALEARGECKILAVTVTKPDDLAGPFVDAMNTFYGHPEIPIGCVRPSTNEPPSRFLALAEKRDAGKLRYPHRIKHGSDAPEPAPLLRKILGQQPDHSVVIVQVGYFTDLAALLDTRGGRELAARKVRLLSVMAGAFAPAQQRDHFLEFNVVKDLAAARNVASNWPTPIVWSGFEIGDAVRFPATSIERDFGYVAHHPAAEAYRLYMAMPYARPSWDLTAALYAVVPDRGYFDLSPPGRVSVEADGFTGFAAETAGRDRYLILKPEQVGRLTEALARLASQPPQNLKSH